MLNELETLLDAVQKAGDAILTLQKEGFTISQKGHDDIVTKADLVADALIKERLLSRFPQDGWLSEETVDDAKRLAHQRVWIVDPIDGTREFAAGIPEYAVSVALVEQGEPILSAVFNPATQEFFHAIRGQGAYLNHQRIYCQENPQNDLVLLASRSEAKRGEWDTYRAQHQVKTMGSIAYKLALIAAGHAQATFSLGPKHEWDIAAGTLLVTEAQGMVTNRYQKRFLFNQKVVKVAGIVATTANTHSRIFEMIRQAVVA